MAVSRTNVWETAFFAPYPLVEQGEHGLKGLDTDFPFVESIRVPIALRGGSRTYQKAF